jgi:hypothetical protein
VYRAAMLVAELCKARLASVHLLLRRFSLLTSCAVARSDQLVTLQMGALPPSETGTYYERIASWAAKMVLGCELHHMIASQARGKTLSSIFLL